MVTVNCDMCGKDISNHDDGRTTFGFPKEDCFVCYDVCRNCANKIEEFIKVSYKYSCEPICPEEQEGLDKWKEGLTKTAMFNKPEPDPCEGKMCYKFDGPSCENCSELVCAYNMYYERYELKCNKKGKIMKIPIRNIVGGMEIYPGSFNKEENKCNKEHCEGCESFNYTSSVLEPGKLHIRCNKTNQFRVVDLEHTVKPEDFYEEEK